jgi:hypothetical protein
MLAAIALGRDVAGGPNLVLDDDGAVGQRPHLLGHVADEHVGAAAGGKAAHEANVLGGIVLRVSTGRDDADRRGERDGRADAMQQPFRRHVHRLPPA